MALIIRGGTLITEADSFPADILIEGEKIRAISSCAEHPQARIIDATGKLIMPGGVDPHTHFGLRMAGTVSSDDHYSGHKAAAFGGTTTVLDFVSLDAPSLSESIEQWHCKASLLAAVDYSFHMNMTPQPGQERSRLPVSLLAEISRLPAEGITSLKVFTAYNQRLRLSDDEIFRVLRLAAENGLLTMLHAENGDVIELLTAEALAAGHTTPEWHARTRPAWLAVEAALRGAALAALAGAPLYLVHMNTAGEVDMLSYARSQGQPIMGETCPQYLFFDQEKLSQPDGAKWVCSPPLRSQADQARLWEGLSNGKLQVIGTDHCPFFYDGSQPILYEGKPVAIPGKELGRGDFTRIPNGLPAVGDRLPILWTYGVGIGRITPNQFVALTSTNPAKIFGLYPQKGALVPGADADLVIWNPRKKVRYGRDIAQHRTDYNLFEGWELTGFPELVLLRGQVIVENGQWLGKAGNGKFIKRQPGAPVL
jgi:dihydropyrimidinase